MLTNYGKCIIISFIMSNSTSERPLIILGADDPEMVEIVRKLTDVGHEHVHATIGGERVGPGNAYMADNPLPSRRDLVFVECGIPGVTPDVVIDHHREGDPGYHFGPKFYWPASSLGQIVTLLELEHTHPDRVLAAYDHCFAAALKDDCPGIDPQDIMELRIRNLSRAHDVSELVICDLADYYVRRIKEADEVLIGDGYVKDLRSLDLGIGYSLQNLTMGLAQALMGVPLIVTETNPGSDGRKKVTIDSDEPAQIEAFMRTWAPSQGLVAIYGVPKRGYAGAYFQ